MAIRSTDDGERPPQFVVEDIVGEWKARAEAAKWLGRTQKLSAETAAQVLAAFGHSRKSIAVQTRLLSRARAGDETAKRWLWQHYRCRVLLTKEGSRE
jgi:hypothetical protein